MRKYLLAGLVCVVVSILTTCTVLYIYKPIERAELSTAKARLVNHIDHLPAAPRLIDQSAFIDAAKKGIEAVVHIKAKKKVGGDFFTREVALSSGSGVIIDANGVIVTNHHVVDTAEEIIVTLYDRKEYAAKLLGSDEDTDIAVLKIEANNLPTITIGNSDIVQVGQWILAIGNPFQLRSSVTAGVISAKARSLNILEDHGIESYIQTDAAVNEGNSGGALVNIQGELIGINAAILSNTGGYQGFSFAIPINLVAKVAKDILEYGSVQRGWLGLTVVNIDATTAQTHQLQDLNGVRVSEILNEGAAQKAGILKNDIIIAINDDAVNDLPSFIGHLSQYRPGDQVNITLWRDSQKKIISPTLLNKLNSTDLIPLIKDPALTELGIEIRDLTSQEKLLHNHKGAYVISLQSGSDLDKTNMKPGYIITHINDVEIASAQDLLDFIKSNARPYTFSGFYKQYSGTFPYTIR